MEALQTPQSTEAVSSESENQSNEKASSDLFLFCLFPHLSVSVFVYASLSLSFSVSLSLFFSLIKSYCNSRNEDTFYTFWKIECISEVYETPF